MNDRPRYTLKHIGINNPDAASADAMTDLLCSLFNVERARETPVSYFTDTLFEIMKHPNRGDYGHFALQTDDVEGAMADLAQRGITFQEDTIRRDENGKVNFVYLQQQIGGFAIHLTT